MKNADILTWRYSTKNFNPSKSITQEQVSALLESLQMSPSAGNIQPWHFFVAQEKNSRAMIAKAAIEHFPEMYSRIMDAPLAIVACSNADVTDTYLSELLEEEDNAGRYESDEQKEKLDTARRKSVSIHRDRLKDLPQWLAHQMYISVGFFLSTAAQLGVDSLAFESIDWSVIEDEFSLREKGLQAHLILLAGHRSADDYNAPTQRPKFRWPQTDVFTFVDS